MNVDNEIAKKWPKESQIPFPDEEILPDEEIDWDRLVEKQKRNASQPSLDKSNKKTVRGKNVKTPLLDQYGVSLNKQAEDGKLDPVYGREKELFRIAQILCRKKKNNPLLLGAPGVGKTALVESLAQKIVEKKVPLPLLGKKIISLDLASLVAGSMYRGQFEERLKGLIAEIKEDPDIILYIDEIHAIMGSGNPQGGLDAANILKPSLARGEIRCIGATTIEEYRKSIEKDGAMDRRFQRVMIEATDDTDTYLVLKSLQQAYESHHHVTYSDEALRACVTLSARYVPDRQFPDKAIDAMDEAGALVFMRSLSEPTRLNTLEQKIEKIHNKKLDAVAALNYEAATVYRDQEREAQKELDDYLEYLQAENKDSCVGTVCVEDIEKVVALSSGIPVESVTADDVRSLVGMEDRIAANVIGQNHVIRDVVRSIQRNKIGLRNPLKPIGTFMFLGSSGVGKTLLSKRLAKELFGSEDALIRIDMSEFMERHTVSRLIGAPPGYIGYDEGGELTEKVLRRPYSVVLFDEIEKAHGEVHNLLLQLLDDGILTDNNGKKISFKNTIIIMTSNVGTRHLKDFGVGIGFRDDSTIDLSKHSESVIQKSLRATFSPEFLNRIDKIVTFNSLTPEDIRAIVDLELTPLQTRLEAMGYNVRFTSKLKKLLAEKGYDPLYGARPLRRTIVKYVEDPITQAILDGKMEKDVEYILEAMDEDGDEDGNTTRLIEKTLDPSFA